MLTKIGVQRGTKDNIKLAGIFTVVSGYTNTLAFLTVGFLVSHVTGTATHFGLNAAKLDLSFIQYGLMLLMFILGAIMSSFIMIHPHLKNSIALLIEGGILLITGLITLPSLKLSAIITINLVPLSLCLAMGIQSASTTYLSSAIVRTTHLTGAATDIGMAIVKKDIRALIILSVIILGFIFGSFLGYFANLYSGIHGFILPGIVITVIGIAYL
ncbi:MAG: YoaK family protein [bacterium]|nr:YoaK family protein [bacterium]